MKRRLAAILFYDVVGFSTAVSQNEALTIKVVKANQRTLIAPYAKRHNGRIIQVMGDGGFIEFASAVEAVHFAVAMQSAVTEQDVNLNASQKLQYRIGINIGDVGVDGDFIYGDGVNKAARLESLARPGGICVHQTVHDQLQGRLDLDFEDLGEVKVKDTEEPIRAYQLTYNEKTTAVAAMPVDTAPPPSVQSRNRWALPALVVTIAATVGLMLWQPWSQPDNFAAADRTAPTDQIEQTNDASNAQPTIIVLPFDNLNNDPEQSYFVDGITEDIITDLSRLTNLRVLARNTSFSYKGKDYNLQEIHEELNVTHSLEGSVRKSGDQLRINTQLVESTNGTPIWADRYDRKLTDIFKVQDDVTQNIVKALSLHLTIQDEEVLKETSGQNFEAYDLYLQGRRLLSFRTQESTLQAKELFTESIALDPNYSRAYGTLAIAFIRIVQAGWSDTPSEDKDEALLLALKGTSLKDRSQDTYWSLGFVHLHRQEYEKAVAAVQEALQIAPNFADGYGLLALINNYLGKPNDSIRLIHKAMKLNPHYSWDYLSNLGWAYYTLGEYEKSVEILMQALERNENARTPRLMLAAAYSAMELLDDAEWEVDEIKTQFPGLTLGVLSREAQFADVNKMEIYLNHLRVAGLPE